MPIASYVPLMMFAVLFGLSMDYQVFLLSPDRPAPRQGDDDRDAVAAASRPARRVIIAAALIMIGVFGSFVLNGDPTVKQFGVGLAVGVALAGVDGARARAGRARPRWARQLVAALPGWTAPCPASTSRAQARRPRRQSRRCRRTRPPPPELARPLRRTYVGP